MLTKEDEAELVERIQRATAGRSWADRLLIAEAWQFMACEVFRMASFWSQRSPPPPPLPGQPIQLELFRCDTAEIDRSTTAFGGTSSLGG